MVDSLGIGDPQAFFLCGYIGMTMALTLVSEKETYAKCPVPAGYGSVSFQEALLNDTHPFAFPPPHVPYCGIRETV